jgi:hypothetical protein
MSRRREFYESLGTGRTRLGFQKKGFKYENGRAGEDRGGLRG